MKRLTERLRAVERRIRARLPQRPWLVVRSNEDPDEALARFRELRGCEPGGTIHIKRAPKSGSCDAS